ncbi:MAG: catalase [Candidatus Thermoplasmatota archaeon]|nr:catalase [Candidatus Thermoplasmatota archaeon]
MDEKGKETLKSQHGIPVGDNQNSTTAGHSGPTLLEDVYLIEKLAHFDRERIPERIVHAKGAGAFGYFEATRDMAGYTKAKFLRNIGKKTPLFVRFSTVAGEKGSADTVRDPRGFAVKFYTEDGNYDLVMNNTPVFFIRDGMKFPDFIHSQKKNPRTNVRDPDMAWDFWSHSPESLHQVTILFSDRGIPKDYRHMNGYSGHTFKWVNNRGEAVWVKYHFKTDQRVQNLSVEDALRIAGEDPDYHTKDLFESIERGEYPSWTVYVQIMPYEEAWTYKFNPFDITKVWPHSDYPLQEIGKLVLNRNPDNYFAEVEQSAFSPANVVPGIEFSPDKMLQARIFAYADTDRYRLGVNYTLIPVNSPKNTPVNNYYRDGFMRVDDNGKWSVNYEPNSFSGPVEDVSGKRIKYGVNGFADSLPYEKHSEDNDYIQAGNLYRMLSGEEKTRLIDNIANDLKNVKPDIVKRQLAHFYKADKDYGTRIAAELGVRDFGM